MLYDDLDPQLNDDDERQRWGGVSRLPPPAMVASVPENTLSPPAPIAVLQRDLRALGFLLARRRAETTPAAHVESVIPIRSSAWQ